MASITKHVLKYSFMPAIAPRLKGFFGSTFSNLAYLIALVFNCVGLIPHTHPYLNISNKGKFGIFGVITETAKHLEWRFNKIDQIIIFFAILLGLFLLASQFLILIAMAFTGEAFASGPFANMFSISAAQTNTDIAYRLLDMVFGAPDIFGNHREGIVSGFHSGLQSMYTLYSHAILVVASIILFYLVVTIIAETAQTGTPFGKRFNGLWAPIRIVAGIGLLIPIAAGMNSGQWITLYAAKLGSNFATNGWLEFNRTLAGGYLGDDHYVGVPNSPEMMHIPAFFMLAHACDHAQEQIYGRNVDAYIVTTSESTGSTAIDFSVPYEVALTFSNFDDIYIRFGSRDVSNTSDKGLVRPLCGELHFSTSTLDPSSGAFFLQRGFYQLIQSWWYSGGIPFSCLGGFGGVASLKLATENATDFGHNYMRYFAPVPNPIMTPPTFSNLMAADSLPGAGFKEFSYTAFSNSVQNCIEDAVNRDRTGSGLGIDPTLAAFGWAAAGIWYNKIAEANGSLGTASQAAPRPTLYPELMEYVMRENMQQDANIMATTRFNPMGPNGRDIEFPEAYDAPIASTYYSIQQYWENDGYRTDSSGRAQTAVSGNKLIDAINAILGTQGVFDMCKNTDVHPLAQLAITGRGLIENSIRNLGYSAASGSLGGLAYLFDPHLGAAGFAGSGFFTAIASIGLLVGFILFYVIPFMPFLYFFFAVGGWVKGVFEAMVGVPLWALAHLRIDGEGLPGSAGTDGYFLIFEIFFRPIMIVIGLIASILIFSAMVKVLNETFFLVVSNLTGFNATGAGFCGIKDVNIFNRVSTLDHFLGPIDEFFFTIVYTVIVYMIGMSCFKLIDNIPNSILRWMNASVSTFNDKNATDPGGIVQKVATKGALIGSSLQEGVESLGQAGKSVGNFGHDSIQAESIRSQFR